LVDRPNLLLITTDQHRGDCLGIAGHPVVETPNLDFMLARGAYFPRAYTEVPSTVGARRTLISGQKPFTHGMIGYKDGVPWEIEHTLPGELAKAGYQTEFVGNMHLYPPRKLFGFHHAVHHEGARGSPDYVDDYKEWLAGTQWGREGVQERDHGVPSNSWIARPFHLPEHCHVTNWTVSMAIHFLKRRDPTMPFFIWISFIKPHAPLDPPLVYFNQYVDAEIPKPFIGDWAGMHAVKVKAVDPNMWRGVLPWRLIRRARAAYYGLITHIDHQLGRLFEWMMRRRLLHRTFVLMASDHGEMLGDHYLYRKSYAYEGSARIPFIIRFARSMDLEPGQTIDKVVGLMDVMPTLLDAAEVKIPETVEGSSVLPLLRGEDVKWRPYLHGEHSACYSPENAMHYLTDGKEKYIWFPPSGREQLFDLQSDPHELHDLAADPKARKRLEMWRNRLVEELAPRGDGLSDGKNLIPQRLRGS